MTQEEFVSAFRSPESEALGHDGLVAQLRERLRRLPAKQQFEILFPISVKAQQIDGLPVLDAARLLQELNPECPVSCEDAVRALLPEWDISLEEVPFYLAAQFGCARVHQAVAALEPEAKEKGQKPNLNSVSYWTHIYDGTWPPKKNDRYVR